MKPFLLMLVAAVIATALGAFSTRHREQFTERKELTGNATDPNRDNEAESEAIRRIELKNTIFVYTLIGASFGLVLSAAAGLINGYAARAGATGLVLGSINGAIAGAISRSIFDRVVFSESTVPLRGPLIHAVLWVLVGAAIAVAVGVATRRRLTGAFIASLSVYGLVAAAVYSPLAGILFPMFDSDRPVPSGEWNSALWTAVPALLFAFSLARSVGKRTTSEASAAIPAPTI